MEKREIWVEGSFAGEFKVEDRLADASGDDALASAFDEDDWSEGDEEGWFDEDDFDEGDDRDIPFFDPGEENDARHCDSCIFGRGDWYEDGGLPKSSAKRPGRRSRNKEIGRRGEDAAARYLERLGYDIIERNYVCPFGEADIVARDGVSLVFVEVKTRTGVSKGFPSEAVDEEKRGRYERIAAWYLASFRETDIPVRFDIVAIMVIAKDRAFLRHYRDAFAVGL